MGPRYWWWLEFDVEVGQVEDWGANKDQRHGEGRGRWSQIQMKIVEDQVMMMENFDEDEDLGRLMSKADPRRTDQWVGVEKDGGSLEQSWNSKEVVSNSYDMIGSQSVSWKSQWTVKEMKQKGSKTCFGRWRFVASRVKIVCSAGLNIWKLRRDLSSLLTGAFNEP